MLCAVSGGADSVCMLYLALEYAKEHNVRVCAAHYEHGIRGEESLRDARFVSQLCEGLGVELALEHGDVPQYAQAAHLGMEEAARIKRYEFLHSAAARLGCDYIATAHNADDNAETMLFNLTRGTGAKGLCGIPARRGNIIRPLIAVTRDEIEQYLRDNAIPHVEDSTNDHDDYSRNLIRHNAMPVLRQINRGFAASCARTGALLRQDEDYFELTVRDYIERHFDGESVDVPSFAALHPAVSSRIVRALWPQTLTQTHVGAVLALAQGTERAYTDLPGGRVRREQGRIYFCEGERVDIPTRTIIPGQTLDVPEAGVRIKTFFLQYDAEINGLFKTYCLKCESIYGNLSCTGKMSGDKIAPIGRGCTKTLKSLFTERHMTRAEREKTVVIRDERGVAAVLGIGVDARFKPTAGDKVLCIETEIL